MVQNLFKRNEYFEVVTLLSFDEEYTSQESLTENNEQ